MERLDRDDVAEKGQPVCRHRHVASTAEVEAVELVGLREACGDECGPVHRHAGVDRGCRHVQPEPHDHHDDAHDRKVGESEDDQCGIRTEYRQQSLRLAQVGDLGDHLQGQAQQQQRPQRPTVLEGMAGAAACGQPEEEPHAGGDQCDSHVRSVLPWSDPPVDADGGSACLGRLPDHRYFEVSHGARRPPSCRGLPPGPLSRSCRCRPRGRPR